MFLLFFPSLDLGVGIIMNLVLLLNFVLFVDHQSDSDHLMILDFNLLQNTFEQSFLLLYCSECIVLSVQLLSWQQ